MAFVSCYRIWRLRHRLLVATCRKCFAVHAIAVRKLALGISDWVLFAFDRIHIATLGCCLLADFRCLSCCHPVFDDRKFFDCKWIYILAFSAAFVAFSPRKVQLPRAERMADTVFSYLYRGPGSLSLEL